MANRLCGWSSLFDNPLTLIRYLDIHGLIWIGEEIKIRFESIKLELNLTNTTSIFSVVMKEAMYTVNGYVLLFFLKLFSFFLSFNIFFLLILRSTLIGVNNRGEFESSP